MPDAKRREREVEEKIMADNAQVPGPNNHDERVSVLAESMYSAILDLVYARKVSTQAFARKSYESKIQAVFDSVLQEELEHERETRPQGIES